MGGTARPSDRGFSRGIPADGSPAWSRLPGADPANRITGMEGFCRMSVAWSAWLADPDNPIVLEHSGSSLDVLDLVVRGLVDGTDPTGPWYWGDIRDRDQRIVEAAELAFTLWTGRDRLLPALGPARLRQVLAWLAQVHGRDVYADNWVLFPAIVATVSRGLGEPVEDRLIDEGIDRMLAWYRGDGWYSDGDGHAFDRYTGWADPLAPAALGRDGRRPATGCPGPGRASVPGPGSGTCRRWPPTTGRSRSWAAPWATDSRRPARSAWRRCSTGCPSTRAWRGASSTGPSATTWPMTRSTRRPTGSASGSGAGDRTSASGTCQRVPPRGPCEPWCPWPLPRVASLLDRARSGVAGQCDAAHRSRRRPRAPGPGYLVGRRPVGGGTWVASGLMDHPDDIPGHDYRPSYGKWLFHSDFPYTNNAADGRPGPDGTVVLEGPNGGIGHRELVDAGGAGADWIWSRCRVAVDGSSHAMSAVSIRVGGCLGARRRPSADRRRSAP